MLLDGQHSAWVIQTTAPSMDVVPGGVVDMPFTVRNDDPEPPEGRRVTVRVAPDAPETASWFTVDRPTRTLAALASDEVAVRVTVPADAGLGSRSFHCFAFSTDDPSADTTGTSTTVAVNVTASATWRLASPPPDVVVHPDE